ncbi:hypothetical protein ANN_20093 [Periplaneta americana]|uniref:Uncharacterized protein n=1 Tax=Periplaneta americana TaxID=6978 RepID=A0ABQ8SCB9_PERAM|nr:hypothetical protein ANN_20093 [Periplaneta americana]
MCRSSSAVNHRCWYVVTLHCEVKGIQYCGSTEFTPSVKFEIKQGGANVNLSMDNFNSGIVPGPSQWFFHFGEKIVIAWIISGEYGGCSSSPRFPSAYGALCVGRTFFGRGEPGCFHSFDWRFNLDHDKDNKDHDKGNNNYDKDYDKNCDKDQDMDHDKHHHKDYGKDCDMDHYKDLDKGHDTEYSSEKKKTGPTLAADFRAVFTVTAR